MLCFKWAGCQICHSGDGNFEFSFCFWVKVEMQKTYTLSVTPDQRLIYGILLYLSISHVSCKTVCSVLFLAVTVIFLLVIWILSLFLLFKLTLFFFFCLCTFPLFFVSHILSCNSLIFHSTAAYNCFLLCSFHLFQCFKYHCEVVRHLGNVVIFQIEIIWWHRQCLFLWPVLGTL